MNPDMPGEAATSASIGINRHWWFGVDELAHMAQIVVMQTSRQWWAYIGCIEHNEHIPTEKVEKSTQG